MNWWARLRNLDRLASLREQLEMLTMVNRELTGSVEQANAALDRMRTRAISAETLAMERRIEADRLSGELARAHEDVTKLMTERLKSLDALNTRLLESRAEPPPPDMSKYRQAEHIAAQGIRRIQQIHQQVDMAVLQKLHPDFARKAGGVVMNQPPAPSAEEAPKGAA